MSMESDPVTISQYVNVVKKNGRGVRQCRLCMDRFNINLTYGERSSFVRHLQKDHGMDIVDLPKLKCGRPSLRSRNYESFSPPQPPSVPELTLKHAIRTQKQVESRFYDVSWKIKNARRRFLRDVQLKASLAWEDLENKAGTNRAKWEEEYVAKKMEEWERFMPIRVSRVEDRISRGYSAMKRKASAASNTCICLDESHDESMRDVTTTIISEKRHNESETSNYENRQDDSATSNCEKRQNEFVDALEVATSSSCDRRQEAPIATYMLQDRQDVSTIRNEMVGGIRMETVTQCPVGVRIVKESGPQLVEPLGAQNPKLSVMMVMKHGACRKNQNLAVESPVYDGCLEFESTTGTAKCDACGCHRNFHQKVTEDDSMTRCNAGSDAGSTVIPITEGQYQNNVVLAQLTNDASSSKGLVTVHGACRKNHNFSAQSPVYDGCLEYEKSGGGAKCDACGCHRNFHEKTGKQTPIFQAMVLPEQNPFSAHCDPRGNAAPDLDHQINMNGRFVFVANSPLATMLLVSKNPYVSNAT